MSNKNLNLLTALRKNNKSPESPDLEELFKSDPLRFNSFSSHWQEILFDYSRTGLNQERLSELHELVTETDFEFCRRQLQEGGIWQQSKNTNELHRNDQEPFYKKGRKERFGAMAADALVRVVVITVAGTALAAIIGYFFPSFLRSLF